MRNGPGPGTSAGHDHGIGVVSNVVRSRYWCRPSGPTAVQNTGHFAFRNARQPQPASVQYRRSRYPPSRTNSSIWPLVTLKVLARNAGTCRGTCGCARARACVCVL